MFDCLETILEINRLLRRLVADQARLDLDLARQIRRAANGMLLNASEARQRAGGDRLHLYRSALVSACEVGDALRAAVAWGFVREADVVPVEALLDRARAILWRLANPRR